MGWVRTAIDNMNLDLTGITQGQQGLPSYLTLNPNGTISFNEGATNRQVIDTLKNLGTITQDDYNWFLDWFSESANQGHDVASELNFLANAGNLDFSNTNFNAENKARVNKLADFMNNTYSEEGFFYPSSTFAGTYGYSATTPKVGVFNRAGGTREVSGGALLSAMPSEAAQYNAMLDVLVPQQESAGLGVFVDPSNLPLYSSDEKQYQTVPPRDPDKDAPMLPPDDDTTRFGGGNDTNTGGGGGGGGGGTDTGPGGPNKNPNRAISKDSPYHGAMFSQGGIVSLSENMDMTPTGGGIESMLMTYESPDYAARERSAATLRRNLEKIASRPTAPGPVPTMQQGIMPMAR
jgi:hypothetical protein